MCTFWSAFSVSTAAAVVPLIARSQHRGSGSQLWVKRAAVLCRGSRHIYPAEMCRLPRHNFVLNITQSCEPLPRCWLRAIKGTTAAAVGQYMYTVFKMCRLVDVLSVFKASTSRCVHKSHAPKKRCFYSSDGIRFTANRFMSKRVFRVSL